MKFSELLDQYLDCRDSLSQFGEGRNKEEIRENIRWLADEMDELIEGKV